MKKEIIIDSGLEWALFQVAFTNCLSTNFEKKRSKKGSTLNFDRYGKGIKISNLIGLIEIFYPFLIQVDNEALNINISKNFIQCTPCDYPDEIYSIQKGQNYFKKLDLPQDTCLSTTFL